MKYDQFTRWHEGFDPKARGAVYEETKDELAKPKEKPKSGAISDSATIGGPHFLTQDSQGKLYTTEGARGRIQQMDSNENALAEWGSGT